MVEGSGEELAHIRQGLDPLRPSLWLGSLIYLTDACSSIGEREVAALVYPELASFGGTNVMIGSGVIFYGAADRYLGMLAATLGDVDAAEAHFAAALRPDRDMGAITWLAHSCYQYARMLMSTDQPGRAEPLIAEAQALAERVGMPALLDHIGGLRSKRPRTPSSPRRSHAARGRGAGAGLAGSFQPRGRFGALDQRAHGGQPRREHPPKDSLREPDRRPPPTLTSAAWSSTDRCLIMPQCLSTSSNVGSPRRSW